MNTHDTPTSRCGYDWCVTAHGATTHPDDEDHRSAGLAVPAFTTRAADGDATLLEVGILRRRGEVQTWLVVEDHAHPVVEIALDSVRRLVRAVQQDPVLAGVLLPTRE